MHYFSNIDPHFLDYTFFLSYFSIVFYIEGNISDDLRHYRICVTFRFHPYFLYHTLSLSYFSIVFLSYGNSRGYSRITM